jgi:hypothetical protein
VAGTATDDARCDQTDAVKNSQTAATPTAGQAGAGCAALPASDESSSTAKPPQTVREFERALRDLGFTRLQATNIARQGYGAAFAEAKQPDPDPSDIEHLRDALQRIAQSFERSP